MQQPDQSRRAFTLIELVVVVVILGIAAAVIVPRLFERGSRAAELSARSLTELVSAIGTRAALGGQRLALRYDARDNRVVPERWSLTAAPARFGAAGEWTDDQLLSAVVLDGLDIRSITVDGFALPPTSWRIESRQGAPAPTVALTVAQRSGSRSWTIDLSPGSLRASMRSSDNPLPTAGVVDLDAQGLDKEPW